MDFGPKYMLRFCIVLMKTNWLMGKITVKHVYVKKEKERERWSDKDKQMDRKTKN